MKEKIEIRKVFILRDSVDRLNLYLYLGRVMDADATPASLRWMIHGSHNPMPVHNGTWFEGFNVSTMLRFFEKNGFTCVDTVSLEPSTKDATSQKENRCLYNSLDRYEKDKIDECIHALDEKGNFVKAIHLARIMHGGTVTEAADVVRKMRT